MDKPESTQLNGFLQAFRKDVAANRLRPLEEYLALFPGCEEEIPAEYASFRRLKAADHPEGVRPADSDGARSEGLRTVLRMIGRYEVLKPLDNGGQGVVFLGRDSRIDRLVAIKTLRQDRVRPDTVERLEREAHVLASIQHSGICPVLDVVEEAGQISIVMPYLKGEDLAACIERNRPMTPGAPDPRPLWCSLAPVAGDSTWAESKTGSPAPSDGRPSEPEAGELRRGDLRHALRLLERIAIAVHAAHKAGVIHRDLKPRNIILRDSGEPVVLDFGLALTVDTTETRLTQEGSALGTPPYMAPEQVEGRLGDIDRRTDVYALGVILYEILTLRLPFHGRHMQELFDQIRRGYPSPIRKLNRGIPRDLESVCSRAMHVDPARRYPTALEFADDLRRVRTLEPTRARPISALERLWRRARLHPMAAFLSAACIMLALGLLLVQERSRSRRVSLDRIRDVLSREAQQKLDGDPASKETWMRVARILDATRAGVAEELVLQAPRGTITETKPVFAVHTGGEPADGLEVIVEGDTVREPRRLRLQKALGSEDRFEARLPADGNLRAGDYTWRVQRTGDGRPADAPQPVYFRVLEQTRWEEIRGQVPRTGSDAIDRVLRACAFLDEHLYQAVIAELEDSPPNADSELVALTNLCLAVAYARLENAEGFERVRAASVGAR